MSDYVWVKKGAGRWEYVERASVDPAEIDEVGPPSKFDFNDHSGPYSRREVLTREETQALETQLGEVVTTRSEMEASMRRNDLRIVEKGELGHKNRRALREWAAEPEATRGPCPVDNKPLVQPKRIDIRKLLETM